VFVSPGQARLRTGWRLLLHGILVVALSVPVAVGAFALLFLIGLVVDISNTIFTALSAGSSALAFVAGTLLARRFLDRRSFISLGFAFDRHTLPDLIVGFLIPLPMLGTVFLLSRAFGWVQWEGWAWEQTSWLEIAAGLAVGLAMFVAVGVAEETLSRGYHLQNLAEAIGLPGALLVSSAVFSALHIGNPGFTILAALGLVLAGGFLATGWIWTRRLWLSIGLHAGWNFFEGTVFGFAVSGLDLFRLMRHEVTGPEWATGGGFGPEAGAVMVPALVLGTGLVWLYTRGRSSST
jgi:membrane protease YdiL (CAAX protease family)